MSLSLPRGAKRWMLSAATGLAVLPSWSVNAAEPTLVVKGRSEPARLSLSTLAIPLKAPALPTLLVKGDGSEGDTPIVTADSRDGGGTIIRTADSSPDGQSAVERELQKLYNRDGREMPPMRKPVPQQPGGAPGTLPQQNAQPIPAKTGVLQKINPFTRKPATDPQSTTAQPYQQPGAQQSQFTPANGGNAAPANDGFELPSRPTTQSQMRQPQSRANDVAPSNIPSPPGGDDFNPFPDEPESAADRGQRRPAQTPRFESQPVRTEAQPRFESGAPKTESEPPRTFAPPRVETPSPRSEEPARPDENPFTGLKLETPPATPASNGNHPLRTESRSASPAASPTPPNPFAAPSGETEPPASSRTIESSRPAVERPSAPDTTATTPMPLPAPSSISEVPEPPKLAAPDSSAFELPARNSTPLPESTPRLRAPELPNENPVLTAPSQSAEENPPRLQAPEITPAPRRSTEPRQVRNPEGPAVTRTTTAPETSPRVTPEEPRPHPRSQPPKPLDPEPAAELPKAPPAPHDRKLRMIAERKGSGFKGFCPVTLREERELVDASPDFTSVYDGKTYAFSSEPAKRKFDRNPEKYAPVSEGNDVILLGNFGRRVPGSLDYAIWYRDRLHLFSSRETLETFVETLSTSGAPKP